MKRRDEDHYGVRETRTDDLPLFGEEKPVGSAPRLHHAIPTSQQAERRLAVKSSGYKVRILAYLTAHGPHTRGELAVRLQIPLQSVCPTVVALRDKDQLVIEQGERDGGALLVVNPIQRSKVIRILERKGAA